MENQTIIYGASDDLIEISGKYSEEMSPNTDEGHFPIGVSDGTLLDVEYDGEWKFRVQKKGTCFKKIIQSVGEDGKHDKPYEEYTSYSDLIIFEGDINWVVMGQGVKF